MLTVKELRERSRMTQEKFGEYFGIPKRTIQNWESTAPNAKRECPEYLLNLMEFKLSHERHIYTIERNKTDFGKLFDYLMEHEPLDKKLKDEAGMDYYPSIIIEELKK